MKYKAVLFDMDGTVLDTLGDLAAAVNHTLREFSMPERSIAEVAAALGNGAAYLIAHTVPAGTPKELTDRDLNYKGAPIRGSRWVERAWIDHGDKVIEATEKYANGGEKK